MISLFELLKIGVGPSSSHTVGPMIAALEFTNELAELDTKRHSVARIRVGLFGSLALTGVGHCTDSAIIAGLCGEHPRTVDPTTLQSRLLRVRETGHLDCAEGGINFDFDQDLVFHRNEFLPQHPNGMRFTAFDDNAQLLLEREFFSVGGGFIADDSQLAAGSNEVLASGEVPMPFRSAQELLEICGATGLTIADVVHKNELAYRDAETISEQLQLIWQTMSDCIEAGCRNEGILPGGLNIPRRAPGIFSKLTADADSNTSGRIADPMRRMDWVTLFALAVNEENAAGGRVVTAPTNGAAGVIPAVLTYYDRFMRAPGSDQQHLDEIFKFLKTSAAIGMLYKRNASLSAAEMGCQGEVGVACSMAAAGLAALLGGSPAQIENAAEIGMEHNLGLTCDPIGGLVQVPCIERNAMGAIKAINAARLAVLYGDGQHRVPLDKVIETMRQTGVDMQSKYKETSLGGLALNVVNC